MSNAAATTTPVRTLDMRALAASVALHLPGWTVSRAETNDHHASLKSEGGPELSLGVDHYRHRIHVRGCWPRDQRNGSYAPHSGAPKISVGVMRSPKSIAREIERRFLPEFLPLWHAAEGRRREAGEANTKAEALAARLRNVFGLPHPEPSRYGLDRDTVRVYAGDATFEVRCYGSVKIEITTSREDVALRVAELVRSMRVDEE